MRTDTIRTNTMTGTRLCPARHVTAAVIIGLGLVLVASACGSPVGPQDGSTPGGTRSSSSAAGAPQRLQGSGATFPKPFYDEVKAPFQQAHPGVKVDYSGGGSGKGKQDLADNIVAFAGTDNPVKPEDRSRFTGGSILYFPTVAAPITVSYHLEGIGSLRLSPETLAAIFERRITVWNDPAIGVDNPELDLPDDPIITVVRSDGSGTTGNFTHYLDEASPSFGMVPGDAPKWPSGTQAGNGNQGVALIVQSTPGSIGYVDYSDAKASGLSMAAIRNRAGVFVPPSLEAASAAVAAAPINPDLTYDALDTDAGDAYPITAGTWIIVYQVQPEPVTATNLKDYLNFLLNQGQAVAESIDFARLPEPLARAAIAQVDQIKVAP